MARHVSLKSIVGGLSAESLQTPRSTDLASLQTPRSTDLADPATSRLALGLAFADSQRTKCVSAFVTKEEIRSHMGRVIFPV